MNLNVICFLRKPEIIFLHKIQPMSNVFFLQINKKFITCIFCINIVNFYEVPFWRMIISRQEIQFNAFPSIGFY